MIGTPFGAFVGVVAAALILGRLAWWVYVRSRNAGSRVRSTYLATKECARLGHDWKLSVRPHLTTRAIMQDHTDCYACRRCPNSISLPPGSPPPDPFLGFRRGHG